MCTAITLQTYQKTAYLGRTMDFSYPLSPHVWSVPEGCRWRSAPSREELRDTCGFLAVGQKLDGILAFFDGVNQRGFAAAALYFAGYARYDDDAERPAGTQVASYDFLHYILGRCGSVEDLRTELEHTYIVGEKDPLTGTVAPLHWIAADRTGACAVLEQTEHGMELYRNPLGTLSNSPDFPWQMTNLRNYLETSPRQTEETRWGGVLLTPFGQAGGTVTLPGGFTSPERFVRAAYLKAHVPTPPSPSAAVNSFFQIMKSVSIPRGAVITARGTDDSTQYTALMNLQNGDCFFNTDENPQIFRVAYPEGPASPDAPTDLGSLRQPPVFQKL